MMLGYTRSVIAGGGAPGTSPGRERLALAGVGAAGMAGLVHGLLKRRIEEADFGDAPDVETESLSPLAFVLRKKAIRRRMSAQEHDLACLRSAARYAGLPPPSLPMAIRLRSCMILSTPPPIITTSHQHPPPSRTAIITN
ncbi:unnamed protein product [Laminaria digitata]